MLKLFIVISLMAAVTTNLGVIIDGAERLRHISDPAGSQSNWQMKQDRG